MSVVAAWIAVLVLIALTVVQAGVAAGAPWGRIVWGGQHRVLPRRLRIGSAASIVLYAGFAWLLLARAGVLPGGSSGLVIVATWVLLGYFALGVLLNAISRSPAERWTMTPACVVLAACALIVSLG